MPIILPTRLPAAGQLRGEGLPVLPSGDGFIGAAPLKVLLVNLMPDKPRVESQFARLLAAAPHLVQLSFAVPENHRWRHTDPQHLRDFYLPWSDARRRDFDALIVTGAPVETVAFESVDYWPEICDMLDWAAERNLRSMFVCWAAQAALYHRYVVPKRALPKKRFGVFEHRVFGASDLLCRVGARMPMPVSRHTETWASDLPAGAGLRIAAASPQSGLGLIEDPLARSAYLFNHPEYDAAVLADEYLRDRVAGLDTALPQNTFPHDDPAAQPRAPWADQGRRLYRNWLDLAASERNCAAPSRLFRHQTASALSGALAVSRHVLRAAHV